VFRVSLILVLALGCDGGGGSVSPDGPGIDAAPTGQGSDPRGDVAVNEVAPGPDWVELVNRGAATADLSGWFLTDAPDRLDHYQELPAGTTLAPGAYLLLPTEPAFRIGEADSVFLLGPTGLTVDALVYLVGDGQALSRLPDHEGLFFPATPTPGEANQ
jgi:hypothetical protein